MKLSLRLSIVVGVIVTILSISVGGFAILYSQKSEIKSVSSLLDAATRETASTDEDKYVVALSVVDSSPLPLGASFYTNATSLSYLSENSANLIGKPPITKVREAMKKPVRIGNSFIIRSIQTGTNQYLIYSMSITAALAHSQSLLINLFIFICLALVLSIFATYGIFRRDSRINQLARSLQDNNQKMQEFLGDASHELRTPLTVIKGYAELMSTNPNHPDIPRYLETVKNETARMERLISDLLLLAELGESHNSRLANVSLDSIVKRKVKELRDLNPDRSIKVALESVNFESDEALVETLLANIFSNIVRHTPADAPMAIEIAEKRGSIQLVIDDGGPGLPNYTPQTFNRFDKSRSRESGGSGLGLSIMQKIALTLGANIEFSKSPLGGLRVAIDFKH